MANNLVNAADILIAGAAPVLREMAVTARRVTTEFDSAAAQKNAKITVTIPSPKTAAAVTTPSAPPAVSDVQPADVEVTLDKWYMAGFALSDREIMELKPGVMPGESEEAMRALVNQVDKDILALQLECPFYYAYTAASLAWADIPGIYQKLFDNLCPITPGDLSVFINGAAQAKLQTLAEFMNAATTGETGALRTGSLGTRLGMDFFANQNIVTRNQGTAPTGFTVNGAHTAAAGAAESEQTVAYNGTVTDPAVGTILAIAGSGNHAVRSRDTSANTMVVRPSLRADVANTAAISYPSDLAADQAYAGNFAFHRRAIAFASRPLGSVESPGTIIRSVSDPLSGITLRLEVKRVGKVTQWEWDILYGARLIRPEMALRIAGK